MKTYPELEGKLGPKLQSQSDQSRPTQPITNPHMKKDMKAIEKRKKVIPVKKYKVKVMEKLESNVTNELPPTTVSKAPTDLENQTPSQEGTLENNPLPLENTPVHAGTPWSEAGKMSGNLFELGKDWPIPPNNNNNSTANATTPKPP